MSKCKNSFQFINMIYFYKSVTCKEMPWCLHHVKTRNKYAINMEPYLQESKDPSHYKVNYLKIVNYSYSQFGNYGRQ